MSFWNDEIERDRGLRIQIFAEKIIRKMILAPLDLHDSTACSFACSLYCSLPISIGCVHPTLDPWMASILKMEWRGGHPARMAWRRSPRPRLTQKDEPAYSACPSPKEDFLHAGNSPIHLPHYEKTNVESRLTKPLELSVLSPRFLSFPRQ